MTARAGMLAVLLSAGALHAQSFPGWVIGPFARPENGNPVVVPNAESKVEDPNMRAPVQSEALGTFGAAAIVRDHKVYVLYGAEDDSATMPAAMHGARLGLAESADGIHFVRCAEPVFQPAEYDQKDRERRGGVEDPRIVELEDGTYVLTYTERNGATSSVGIASSKDLEHWTGYGPAFSTGEAGNRENLSAKSAGIVTHVDAQKGRLIAAKIDGKYWMYWGEGAIHLATSEDAIHWTPVEDAKGQPTEVLCPRPGHFDSSLPEIGPPPVLTNDGIVLLYNGKNAGTGDAATGPNAYAAGEALFEASDPAYLIDQTDHPGLKPEMPHEKAGEHGARTTFAEGLVFFHGKWFLYYGGAESRLGVATAPAPAPPGAGRGFYLHPDDRVVFYGDSITEQNYYNQWVQLYTATRFPKMRVHFYDAGVGGDSVRGGLGGPIDERLERDVFVEKPTVILIMLGMNDGRYRSITPEIESTYRSGYEHILASIREHAPDARLTLLGPTPYDDITAPPEFPGGYNGVMQDFANDDRQLAQEHHAAFINLNPPMVAALEKAKALNPQVAKLLLPDRVHPAPTAHWVMAEMILKAWDAPALVSSVTIDAVTGRATNMDNANVGDVQKNGAALRWTQTENALPLPLRNRNVARALLFEITDVNDALNQEPLTVTGLPPGQYMLRIDKRKIGTFSAADLARGINLADFNTPMLSQAEAVGRDVRDLIKTHFVHLRMRMRDADTGAEHGGADLLQAFEYSMEDRIYADAAPLPHHFLLEPVATPAASAGSH